jgi:hypothetical protein
MEHCSAISFIDGNLGTKLSAKLLGNGNTATHDNDIDIGRGATEIVVANISADDIGFDT